MSKHYRWQDKTDSIENKGMPLIESMHASGRISTEDALAMMEKERWIAYRHTPDNRDQAKDGINQLSLYYCDRIEQIRKERNEEIYHNLF